VFLATTITLLGGYPWLTLQENESLDPHNPYKTLFLISNEGYFPATNIDVNCEYDFFATTRASNGKQGGASSEGNLLTVKIGGSLWHGQSTQLPCTRVLSMNDKPVIPGGMIESFSTMQIPSAAQFSYAKMAVVIHY